MILALFANAATLFSALAAWAACWRLIRKPFASEDWRFSWVVASVVWGAWLTIAIELGSKFAVLSRWYFLVVFAVPVLLACLSTIHDVNRQGRVLFASKRLQFGAGEMLLLGLTASFVVLLAIQGALTAPNTYDAMTYHLPRVMHWMQQGSVEFYPTLNTRQLESGPWANYAMLSLYSISGGDRLLWVVQWFAMVTSLVGISLITSELLDLLPFTTGKRIGSPARLAPIIGPFLMAMLPMGIAQAVTAQNDNVTTCWLVCFVAVAFIQRRRPDSLPTAVTTGLTFGLGALTKATFLLFAVPLAAIAATLTSLRLRQYRQRVRLIAVWALCIVVLNAPHAVRNLRRFGSPLGSSGTVTIQSNANFTVAGTASNVIRNLTLNTGTGSRPVTRLLNDGLLGLHRLTGRDLNDPTSTFPYTRFTTTERLVLTDSVSNSVYHLLLVILASGVFIFTRRRYGLAIGLYVAAIVCILLAFCGYLRWQPWHSRFHMSFYALLMPFVAVVLTQGLTRLVYPVASGFLALGLYSFFTNESRAPFAVWFNRDHESKYFLMVPDWHKAFVSAAETIVGSGCANVGYAIGFDSWEYPIWAMLKNRGFAGSLHSIEDSGQPNDGSLLRAMQPCAVLVMGMDAPAEVLRTMGRAQPNAPIPIYSPMWPQTKAEPKPPQPVSVTPASGTGRHQVFVFKVKNLAGASDLAGTALLIGSSVGASGSCYILYDGVGGGMDLATDSGRWTKFRPVGRATVLKNSQCRVDLSKSSVQSQGLELMVSVDVTFDGRFAGAKQLYVYTSTRAGLSDSWHEMGSWVVP